MSPRRIANAVLLSLPLLAGCYESSVPLGSPERVMVSPELLGTWACREASDESKLATLLVVAYDRSRYFLEWRDKDETTRWAAHASEVGGALLYNVRELRPDGRETKWVFLRASTPVEARLLLAVVDGEELKKLGEPEAFREIRRRVRDESLYKPWAACQRTASPR